MTATEKPTIVHVIDDLGRGGAETLLVDLLKDLDNYYNIVLVTLTGYSEFGNEEIRCQHRYSLDYKNKFSFPSVILKLKKIIRKHKPALVRSQLYWSTIVARIACPAHIPLVFSVHVTLSDGSFKFTRKGAFLKWLERSTYKRRHIMVGVTQEVVADYDKTIGLKGKRYVLHNYVKEEFFQNAAQYVFPSNGQLRLVAVGNPKKQKNYELLLAAFRLLDNEKNSCAIYGRDNDNEIMQRQVDEGHLSVRFEGQVANIYEKLKEYDLFIMPSLFEGFGIAVAEAMAVGLPVFLSDIGVLREVSCGNAVFFNPHNAQELADKINDFRIGKYDAAGMSQKGKEISNAEYSRSVYLKKLVAIYNESIQNAR